MTEGLQYQNSKQLAKSWLEWQHYRHEHPNEFGLIRTGLTTLDERLGGGLETGQLVYMGGAQKSGKSTWLVGLAKALGEQKKFFIWFGAEMNTRQTGTLLFSNISGIDRTRIRNPHSTLSVADWQKLEDAASEIETFDGYWTYGFSTLSDIHMMLNALEAEGIVVDAILGDYIQLMEDPTVRDTVRELTVISRGLKRLTMRPKKHPLLVAFAAQFNRSTTISHIVSASSYLGSGSLERDADVAMGVTDVIDPMTNQASDTRKQIMILASRETQSGKPLMVGYNGAIAQFYDLPSDNKDGQPQLYWR